MGLSSPQWFENQVLGGMQGSVKAPRSPISPQVPLSSPDLVGSSIATLFLALAAAHEPHNKAYEEKQQQQGAQDPSDDDRHSVVSCGCERERELRQAA